ncbi:hypothetical protein C8K63_102126 [Pseudomonas sp. GV085]|nr:hypothetical protein C8K63_102126 [Pseudomonas sp. GV085]
MYIMFNRVLRQTPTAGVSDLMVIKCSSREIPGNGLSSLLTHLINATSLNTRGPRNRPGIRAAPVKELTRQFLLVAPDM